MEDISTELLSKFRSLSYENSPDSSHIIDQNAKIIDVNKAFTKILGYTKEEAIGMSGFNLVPDEGIDAAEKAFDELKDTNTLVNWNGLIKRKDNTIFPALVSAALLFDDGSSKFYYINIKDVTEHEKIKQELDEIKFKKFATIGEFSSRLAHDLRNPLSVIKASNDIIKSSLSNDDKKNLERFERIDDAVNHMYKQIQNVLDFVKDKPLSLEYYSAFTLINNAVSNLKVPSNVKINVSGEDTLVKCDFSSLLSVLTNLCTNSIHAIDNNGEINIHVHETNDKVEISVTDTGSGILEENLSRIFTPLFTTKQEGTGLGLSSCKNIIQQHKGTISVKNNPTTFTITLPKN